MLTAIEARKLTEVVGRQLEEIEEKIKEVAIKGKSTMSMAVYGYPLWFDEVATLLTENGFDVQSKTEGTILEPITTVTISWQKS